VPNKTLTKIKEYVFLSFTIGLVACNQANCKINTALNLSGDNRKELEKAISYYEGSSEDILKLKAVKFLIENMPGHYTLSGDDIDKYRKNGKSVRKKLPETYKKDFESIDSIEYFSRKVLDILMSYSLSHNESIQHKNDVENISSDYLINHIEAAFRIKDNTWWLQDIPFDDFLEYILPYRIESEQFDIWLDSIEKQQIYDWYTNTPNISKQSILQLENSFNTQGSIANREFINKFIQIDFDNNCFGACTMKLLWLRSIGIPAALDFIPAHPNRNGRHYWCEIISPEVCNGNKDIFKNYSAAKIYRQMFSIQNDYKKYKNEFLPSLFSTPFYKDVTSEYLKCSDIYVKNIKENISPRYAYLAVFNNLRWEPVAISEFKGSRIHFKKMGHNVLYLPMYYKGNLKHPFNYPFILKSNNKIKYLIPDNEKHNKIRLERKYPYNMLLDDYSSSVKNVTIEASDNNDWNKCDTINFDKNIYGGNIVYELYIKKRYRYYRIKNMHNKNMYVSELLFIGKDKEVLPYLCDSIYNKINDNDILNYQEVKPNNYIVFDFKEPIEIRRLICYPRSDGNSIYIGNEYELFYHELNGWHSLGKKVATDCFLEYKNVPNNALLWLRNLSTGVEERPFVIENGKILFW